MTPKIITLANRKGGAGKTTAATTIASGLAYKGNDVLLIDLDGQASVSRWLGLPHDAGAYALLTLDLSLPASINMIVKMIIETERPHLFVLPGNESTYDAAPLLAGQPVSYLRKRIMKLFASSSLKYIIIDTQPGKSKELQEMAIWAADYLIIPVACAQSSLDGLYSIWQTMTMMKEEINPTLRWPGALLGILVNEYEEGRTASVETLETATEKCSEDAILGPVHRAQIFKQMEGQGLTLWEKDPNSRAAKEYSKIISRITRLR